MSIGPFTDVAIFFVLLSLAIWIGATAPITKDSPKVSCIIAAITLVAATVHLGLTEVLPRINHVPMHTYISLGTDLLASDIMIPLFIGLAVHGIRWSRARSRGEIN